MRKEQIAAGMAKLTVEIEAGLTPAEEIAKLKRMNQELESKLAAKERELQRIKETVESFVKKNVCHVVSRYHEREFVRNKLSRNFDVLLKTIFDSLDNLDSDKLTEIISQLSHRFGAILASEEDSETVDRYFDDAYADRTSKFSAIFDALTAVHKKPFDRVSQDPAIMQLKKEADEAVKSLLGVKSLKANVSKRKAYSFSLKTLFFIEFVKSLERPTKQPNQFLREFAKRKCELEYHRFQGTLWHLYDERKNLFSSFKKELTEGDPVSNEVAESLSQVEVLWTSEILISKAWHVARRILNGQSDIFAMKELRDLSDQISAKISKMHGFVAKWFFITEDTFKIAKLHLIRALVGAVILCNVETPEAERVERWREVSKDYQDAMENLSQVEQILRQQLQSLQTNEGPNSARHIRGLLELTRVTAYAEIRKIWVSEVMLAEGDELQEEVDGKELDVLSEKKRRKQQTPESPKDDTKKRRKKDFAVLHTREEIMDSMRKCFDVFVRAHSEAMRLIGSEIKIFVPKDHAYVPQDVPITESTRPDVTLQGYGEPLYLDPDLQETFKGLFELDITDNGFGNPPLNDSCHSSFDGDSNGSLETGSRGGNHRVHCEICLGLQPGPCAFHSWFEENFEPAEDKVVVVEFMCDQYRIMMEGLTVKEIYAQRNNRDTSQDEPFYDMLYRHLHVNQQLRPTRKRKDENWYKTERHVRAIRNGKKTYEQLGQYVKGWQPRVKSFFKSYFDELSRLSQQK